MRNRNDNALEPRGRRRPRAIARLASPFPLALLLAAALCFGAVGPDIVLAQSIGDTGIGGTAGFVSEFPLSVEPVPYDLTRVVERALSHHLGVRVSRLQSAAAERQAIQQLAALKPSLSVTATPNWFATPGPDPDALDIAIDSEALRDLMQDVDWDNCDVDSCPGLDDLLDEFSDQISSIVEQLGDIPQKLYPGRGVGVTLNGAVPLWRSPLQRAVADAAEWQQARAEVGVDEAAAGAILQSIDAYFAVLRAEAELRIAELSLAEAELRLEEVADRVRAGTATNMDRLQTEAERYGAEARLLQAKGEVTAARMMLNSVLGFDLNVPLHVAPPGPGLAAGFASGVEVGDALRFASRTGEVRQAYADLRLAEAGAVISEEQAKPSLRVFGTYKWPDVELTLGVDRHGYLGGNASWSQTYLEDERVTNDDPNSWFAGFELTWNVFDGGKQRAEAEAARLQAEQARVYHEHVEQTARAEVLSAYVRWQAAAEAVEGVARGVEAAGQGVEVARRLAESGAATRSAVLQAEIGLARAEQGYVDALYGAAMAHSAYLHAAGELVPYWRGVLAARP